MASQFFGTFIFLANLYNYKKSPVYIYGTSNIEIKILSMSLFKGFIYGSVYPFSLTCMSIKFFFNADSIDKHFIPFSVYGGTHPKN